MGRWGMVSRAHVWCMWYARGLYLPPVRVTMSLYCKKHTLVYNHKSLDTLLIIFSFSFLHPHYILMTKRISNCSYINSKISTSCYEIKINFPSNYINQIYYYSVWLFCKSEAYKDCNHIDPAYSLLLLLNIRIKVVTRRRCWAVGLKIFDWNTLT